MKNHKALTRETLNGIYAGVPTPCDSNGNFLPEVFIANLQKMSSISPHGIYTTGTTGEFYALEADEFDNMVEALSEGVKDFDGGLQIGCTWINTREVIRRIEKALSAGIPNIQIAPPFWIPLRKAEILQFYKDIYSAVPEARFIIYNTNRSKNFASPEMMQKICNVCPNIIGQKFGDSDIVLFHRFTIMLPELSHFVGESGLVPSMLVGGRGSYSAFVYLMPKTIISMYELSMEKKWEEARALQQRVNEYLFNGIWPLIEKGYLDPVLDKAMAAAGNILDENNEIRRPILKIDDDDFNTFVQRVKKDFSDLS